jgi:hypothetical protein
LVEENKQKQKLRRLKGSSGWVMWYVSGSFDCGGKSAAFAQDDTFSGVGALELSGVGALERG